MGLFDYLGDALGGSDSSSKGWGWSPLITVGLGGILSWLASNNQMSQQRDITEQNQQWTSSEAQKNRDLEQSLLQQKLEAEMAAAGAGAANQAAQIKAQTALQGGALYNNAIQNFLRGIGR